MVTRRAAELLLELAARRWPADVRDDLRREWAAELHVLADSGHRTKMVGFAVSLAVSRTGAPIVDRRLMHGRVGRTLAALLLSPIACVGIVLVSAYSLMPIERMVTPDWSQRMQKPIWTALTVGLAVLLAVFAARWARHTALDGPLRIALGVVLPIGVTAVVFLSAVSPDAMVTFVPGLLLWLAGLTLALWAAAVLAGRNRLRAAWWVGVLGALTAADLAVILAVVDVIAAGARAGPVSSPTPLGGVDWISSPLWLLATWTEWNISLPRPTISWEIFHIVTNEVRAEPMLYLACTPYALAYTIRAARSAPAETVALAPTPV
ncbi:hypothetical protein ABTW72_19090 [Micromonospora sp. NPDC127501]|uniref:hypothetical protein n=1 Tax=Micromonospora sp. NPDC127501 TaxID=3154872 RepID=UPI00331E48E7